jgi:hypothetical protein
MVSLMPANSLLRLGMEMAVVLVGAVALLEAQVKGWHTVTMVWTGMQT